MPCNWHSIPQERPGACYGGSNGAGNAPNGPTVKIPEHKDKDPLFVNGESDEP